MFILVQVRFLNETEKEFTLACHRGKKQQRRDVSPSRNTDHSCLCTWCGASSGGSSPCIRTVTRRQLAPPTKPSDVNTTQKQRSDTPPQTSGCCASGRGGDEGTAESRGTPVSGQGTARRSLGPRRHSPLPGRCRTRRPRRCGRRPRRGQSGQPAGTGAVVL
jgi:hypothetical protein